MIATEFLAVLFFHHRPNLCSCPTPATRKSPEWENDRELINPFCKSDRGRRERKERERQRERKERKVEGGGGITITLNYSLNSLINVHLTSGTLKHSSNERKFSPHFHKQMCPSLDPESKHIFGWVKPKLYYSVVYYVPDATRSVLG